MISTLGGRHRADEKLRSRDPAEEHTRGGGSDSHAGNLIADNPAFISSQTTIWVLTHDRRDCGPDIWSSCCRLLLVADLCLLVRPMESQRHSRCLHVHRSEGRCASHASLARLPPPLFREWLTGPRPASAGAERKTGGRGKTPSNSSHLPIGFCGPRA